MSKEKHTRNMEVEPFDASLLPSIEMIQGIPAQLKVREEELRKQGLLTAIARLQAEIQAKSDEIDSLQNEIEHGEAEKLSFQLPDCRWVSEDDPRAIEYEQVSRTHVLACLGDIGLRDGAPPLCISYEADYDSDTPSYRRNSFRASIAKRAGMYIIGTTVITPKLDWNGSATENPTENSSALLISDKLDYPLVLDNIDPSTTTTILPFDAAGLGLWHEMTDEIESLANKFIASRIIEAIKALVAGIEPQQDTYPNGRKNPDEYTSRRTIPLDHGIEIDLQAKYWKEQELGLSSVGVSLQHKGTISKTYVIDVDRLHAVSPPNWRQSDVHDARALIETALAALEKNNDNR